MTDEDKAHDIYQYFSYCRNNGHEQYLKKAELALAFFIGQQWTEEETSKMRETGRPALTINQFFRDMDSIIGEMISSTGDVRFTPVDPDGEDVSELLDKIYLSTAQQNYLTYIEPSAIFMGMLTGRGYYDVRMSFDDQMQGNVKITVPRPQNIVLSPDIDSRDPSTWDEVFTTSMASTDKIALLYGEAAAKEIGDTPQSSWLSSYDTMAERMLSQRLNGGLLYDPLGGDPRLIKNRRIIERQYKQLKYKEFFIDQETGDMSEVPENWDRNRIARMREVSGVEIIKRRAQTIRWSVTCDRFVLHDEDSPYNYFTQVPFMPYFIDGYAMGLGDQLVDMQRMTNKLYSQVLHILNSAANSGWKVKTGSMKNMTSEELETKGAQTGLVAELDDVKDLERIQPGQLPSGHDSLAQTIRSMFHDISGYTETMQGQAAPDTSRKALDTQVARGSVNLATAYNGVYHTKTMVAQRVQDLVRNFYTETRMMRFAQGYGRETQAVAINQPTPEGTIANDVTRGKYGVVVVPTMQRETMQQTTFQQLKEMRLDLGMMIPDDVMIEYSTLPQKTAVLDAMKNAGGDPQQQQQQAQMQQQIQMLDMQLKQAQAQNSAAQAELAQARARKADADSQRDPNADRMALDAARLQTEQQRDAAALAAKQQQGQSDTALKLTDMQLTHQREMKKLSQPAAPKPQK